MLAFGPEPTITRVLALHLDIVGLGNSQKIVTLIYCDLVLITVLVNEGNIDSRLASVFRCAGYANGTRTYSSPGLGGSQWPCELVDVAENARLN